MKFGSVDNPGSVDLSLPGDHPDTAEVLSKKRTSSAPGVYVGCAKWNRQELKNFYPRGTKDELAYYATRFNAIELNATFYRNFPPEQVTVWYDKVPDNFRFFPKVNQQISHRKWLADAKDATEEFLNSVSYFREKLGTIFLQMRGSFSPKHFKRVQEFIEYWPREIPLAVELRHPDWFADPGIARDLYRLLEEHNIANVIVDTAGRRDLMHMRLTNNEAFVRYVGANHPTDYARLDEWVERLRSWVDQGLRNIHFFVHQNVERESPELAKYFIQKLKEELKHADCEFPAMDMEEEQQELF